MQAYLPISDYIDATRSSLQDLIPPFRYSERDVLGALNYALFNIQRIRPDMFIAFKYAQSLRAGDIDDAAPTPYTLNMSINLIVPIPGKYFQPIIWFMSGWLQLYDVADSQDQRAQAFMAKFQQQLMSVSAA